MNYRSLTLQDIEHIRPFFLRMQSKTCDYSIGGMCMWRDFYKMEFAVEGQTFYSRLYDERGRLFYNLPLSENIPEVLAAFIRSCREEKAPVRFCTVPEPYLPLFREICPSARIEEQPDYGDYLYQAKDLAELKGKKYNGQRNQIHQFLRNVSDWSFEEIDAESLDEITSFFTEHYMTSAGSGRIEAEENAKVLEVLGNYENYGMQGGVLRADGIIVGFSLNEIIGDTLFTHVEKASRDCKGAYQMLVNQTAKKFAAAEIKYINREEDMGDPGLRTAKLAYHPVAVLKKYIVEVE